MITHVDSLDIITEEFLDLLTLDRGVDNNVVSDPLARHGCGKYKGNIPLVPVCGGGDLIVSFFLHSSPGWFWVGRGLPCTCLRAANYR
jgi:hypothetical protein